MTKKTKDKLRRVTAEEGWRDYVMLGPTRSLSALRELYGAIAGVRVPSPRTIDYWSANGKWQERIREHEASISTAVQEHKAGETVNETIRIRHQLRTLSSNMLKQVNDAIPALKLTTANEVRQATDAAIAAMQLHERLRGSVSDKEEEAEATPQEDHAGNAMRRAEAMLSNIVDARILTSRAN